MANPTIKAKAVLDTTQFSSSLNKLQHDLNGLTKAVPGLGNAIGLLKNPITITVGALAGLGKMFASSATYGDSFARACGAWDGALQGFQNALTNFDFSNFLDGMRDAIELGADMADTLDNLQTERAKKDTMAQWVQSEIHAYERQYRLNVQNGMSRKQASQLYNQQIESLEPRYNKYVKDTKEQTERRVAQLIKDIYDKGGPGTADRTMKLIKDIYGQGGPGDLNEAIKMFNSAFASDKSVLSKELHIDQKQLEVKVDDILKIMHNNDNLYNRMQETNEFRHSDYRTLYGLDNEIVKSGIMQFIDPKQAKATLKELLDNLKERTGPGWKSAWFDFAGRDYDPELARQLESTKNTGDVLKLRQDLEKTRNEVAKRLLLIATIVDRNADDESKQLDNELKNLSSLYTEQKVGLESYKKLERPEKETKSETKAINVKPSTLGLTTKDLGLDKDMLAEIDNSKEVQAVSELESKLQDELDVLNQILSIKQQLNDMGVDTSAYEAIADSDKDQLEMLKTRLVLEKDAAKDEEEKKKKAQEQRELVRDTANTMSASFSEASSALGQFADQSEEAAIASKSLLIASAIGKLVAQFAVIPKGTEIWSWIAGTVAGTATLVATIASLKSFQTGGIVHGKGTAYSDSIPIMVSDGEMMLNPLQQTHLFDILNHPGYLGGGTPTLRTRITGDNIDFILDTNERFKSKLL